MDFVRLEKIEELDKKTLDKMYKRYYNPGLHKIYKYTGLDINFTRAEGMYLYDEKGKKYLDCLAGFGALNLGYNDERVIEAVNKAALRPNLLHLCKNPLNAVLAQNLAYLTDDKLSISYFVNGGTEAVEEAIKLALFYHGGGDIIYFSKAYHGKTLGSISALGNKLKWKYEDLPFNFIEVNFGDYEGVKEAVHRNSVAAILVEPIQGEGGVNIAPKSFFKEIRKLCNREDIVLIFDEIQTGLGRCGSMFYYEKIGTVPDILCLSKSLGGGIIPISSITSEYSLWMDTYGKIKYSDFIGCTFGGNTLACAAAIKTLDIICDDRLALNSEELGIYALSKLEGMKSKYPLVKDIRGEGLLIGIELDNFNNKLPAKAMKFLTLTIITEMMNRYGIIMGFTSNNPAVLRFEPPLIINKKEVDYFVECLKEVLDREDSLIELAFHSIKNIGCNLKKMWEK